MRKFLSVIVAMFLLVMTVSIPADAADTVIHTQTTTNTTTESPVNLRDSVTVLPPQVSIQKCADGSIIETTIEKTITVSKRVKTTVEKITVKTIKSPCQVTPSPQPSANITRNADDSLAHIEKYASARGWKTIVKSTNKTSNTVVMNLRFTGRSGYMDIVQTTTYANGRYSTSYSWANQYITLESLQYSLEIYK